MFFFFRLFAVVVFIDLVVVRIHNNISPWCTHTLLIRIQCNHYSRNKCAHCAVYANSTKSKSDNYIIELHITWWNEIVYALLYFAPKNAHLIWNVIIERENNGWDFDVWCLRWLRWFHWWQRTHNMYNQIVFDDITNEFIHCFIAGVNFSIFQFSFRSKFDETSNADCRMPLMKN